jgi:hypothetical protein
MYGPYIHARRASLAPKEPGTTEQRQEVFCAVAYLEGCDAVTAERLGRERAADGRDESGLARGV